MEERDCFGVLDQVFPVSERGMREVVAECFQCPEKVPCLKKALASVEGLKMRGEILDRTPATGVIGRLKRWSQRKELSRLMDEKKKRT